MSVAFEQFNVNAERAVIARDFYIKSTQSYFLGKIIGWIDDEALFLMKSNVSFHGI
jgi:hypothetical protein